jgi:Tol biopolymer transport system component
MGEVYRARDERLGRDVAVKVLPAGISSDQERLRRFEQEARAAGLLNHPNILAIYDVGSHDGAPYVVSELLEGETLRTRLGGSALPPRKAIDYGTQIARGLGAAHDKGIVHRDLKPENLFVTGDGRVKILDFGLAKLTRPEGAGTGLTSLPTTPDETEPGKVLGTIGYMSPEQVRGRPADHRSDIFSLGAILFEMLTGRRAFRGESAVETMNAILKDEPADITEISRTVSPALERIVRHCLEKGPEERFQSARDVAFDLEAVSGLTTPGAGTPAIARHRAGRRLRPALATLTLHAALGAAFRAGRQTAKPPAADPPVFHRLTTRRGTIRAARFAPDGQTIIYSAVWDGGPTELFLKRHGVIEPLPLALPGAVILAISPSGEMAVSLRSHVSHAGVTSGTLARVTAAGGAPREALEGVQQADWSPDGTSLAIVREIGRRSRLEYPIGKVLYETDGHISFPRVSPQGDRVAFLDHPFTIDDRGSVAVVDTEGRKQTLSSGWMTLQGLAWSPPGDEIWFSGSRTGPRRAVYALRASGGERPVSQLTIGTTLHDISRDGHVLVSSVDWRSSIFGLVPGERQERDLSWLDFSGVPVLSNDGSMLLFNEENEAMGPDYATCLRKTDGSAAIRLGDGFNLALSPDKGWALALRPSSPGQLILYPAGPGEPRTLEHDTIETYLRATWFPDGRRILFMGNEAGHAARLYVGGPEGGKPRPITPEGAVDTLGRFPISPDGRTVAVTGRDRKVTLYSTDGDDPRPVTAIAEKEYVIGWSADGRSLYLQQRFLEVPNSIVRFDLSTGRRTLIRELRPADPAGVDAIYSVSATPDGRYYAYSFSRVLAELYLVEGWK